MQKMKRAAIYARFSSDRQNDKSCRDQINLASAWAQRSGFDVVKTYEDHAISGASTINRKALNDMLRDAQHGAFDTVICEALDRLSRDQADLAQIRKTLSFHGVSIHTVQDGEVGTIHIGIKGLMGELYLADLAQKTKRGLRAVVNEGRQAGGKSYGYNSVGTGELEINQEQADVIRRIFDEYINGKTPREIARDLNADGVLSPRGGKWNASTINGSRSRQNGILQNRLYVGKIVWNRQRFIKNPETGKRVSRLNPESEWIIQDAEHLRIIDDLTYRKAAQLKGAKGSKHSHHARRPKHVFTGLLKCGYCGAGYTIFGRDRIGCCGNRERGDCDNKRTVSRKHIEQRVLTALQKHLAAPELIAEYVKAYQEEQKNLRKSNRSNLADKKRRLGQIKSDIDRLIEMVLRSDSPDSFIPKINDLEAEQKALQAEVEKTESEQQPIELHPALADKYRKIVESLHRHMDNLTEESRNEIFAEIRKLIEKIVITPTADHVDVEVHGSLAALLSVECRGLVVAGACNNQYPTYLYSA